MANLGVTPTTRSVNRNKRRTSNAHKEHVGVALVKYSENAFVLNIDDYYNIHTPYLPDSTTTSFSSSMSTILADPCLISPIPRIGAINPNIVDYELIARHLDERFIVNLGFPYCFHSQDSKKICSEDELVDRLMVHSYNDRIENKTNNRHTGFYSYRFIKNDLKGVVGYMNALRVVHNQEPIQEYLFNNAIPIVADWPGQFYIHKAIAHRYLLNNETISSFVTSFLPMIGPLHVSLNARELIFVQNLVLFNDVYKGVFGAKKKSLGNNPQLWRIDRIFHIMRMAWLEIADVVYLKFSRNCKNIEFLYLTDLLRNLIPLALDIYTIHHREDDWTAYEEAYVFYWMETNHPMFNMIVNNLDSLSDSPVEIVHSIIRRCTSKFFTAEQLQMEVHCIFQNRKGYEVSDRHLPRGFVTAKKPSIVALCDYVHCRNSNYSVDGIVLACGHGYHNHCLQICQFKCLICLEYLNDKIIENVNALMKSLKKKLDEKEPDVEDVGIIDDDNSDNTNDVVGDIPEDLLELENAKESFLKIS
ncbi:hypothetical protein C2G38_2272606 [Gigaspora rosea]|uniref:Uncharacterized protein n=1 Tax=Gigaspora rosea TaxID=44941 RepID=A0A397UE80_9GLOM|nr:hypothetical protein C2G38_2272606 [Gigaspora rosea]